MPADSSSAEAMDWHSLSALQKARRYAAEYRRDPAHTDELIHKHWLMVLDDEIERLAKAQP